MIDTIALAIGYAMLALGGVCVLLFCAWQIVELIYRRAVDVKLLTDFIRWKRTQ